MNIPRPNEFAKQGGFNPFPPRWERWLSSVRASILASQPQAGRHVSIDEHPGKGTVINVDDTSARRPSGGGGVCPDVETVTATLSGITLNCGCIDIYDGETFLGQWLWSDPYGINTSYALTRDGFDPTHWFLDPAGLLHIKTWTFTEPNCPTDPPFIEDDIEFHMHAYCVDGTWNLFVTFGASPISLFFYGIGTTGSTMMNAVPHCGFPQFVLDMGGSSLGFIGANTDGSAVISL